MNHLSIRLILVTATIAVELAPSESGSANPQSLKTLWRAPSGHVFHQALGQGIGFSFLLDEQQIGPAIVADSNVTVLEDDHVHEAVFRHASGLAAIRRCREFPEYDAVEYTIEFRNESTSTTAPG